MEVRPPFLVITVRDFPQKPWPLTVGGLPLRFTQDESADVFDRGISGRRPKAFDDVDLRVNSISDEILKRVGNKFVDSNIRIKDICWFSGFWRITVPDDVPRTQLPCLICECPAYYRKSSEAVDPDPAALRIKPPPGIDWDDTSYIPTRNALLHPGIMLSSSRSTTGTYKSSTQGFEDDGWVYHPDPNGQRIGRIVDILPDTDISIAEIEPGLRYVNETFGSGLAPTGVPMRGISPDYASHLRIGDTVTMDNPYTGQCEGRVLGIGLRTREDGELNKFRWVKHEWFVFENGDEAIDGSCGTPILKENGLVVGFFRFRGMNNECSSVSTLLLREYGYEICGETQTFA